MNLYLRLLWTLLAAPFKPRIAVGDMIEVRLRVWPGDLDANGHMNNGRYMSIVDLALIEYFWRAGFLRRLIANGWRPMLGGAMISFRSGLKPFEGYRLRFAVQCWDERWCYMRFSFLRGGRIVATGQSKGAVVGRSGIVASAEALKALGVDRASPMFPASLTVWLEAERLMQQDGCSP
jgi:acyl-CoA thioesterase FadM